MGYWDEVYEAAEESGGAGGGRDGERWCDTAGK